MSQPDDDDIIFEPATNRFSISSSPAILQRRRSQAHASHSASAAAPSLQSLSVTHSSAPLPQLPSPSVAVRTVPPVVAPAQAHATNPSPGPVRAEAQSPASATPRPSLLLGNHGGDTEQQEVVSLVTLDSPDLDQMDTRASLMMQPAKSTAKSSAVVKWHAVVPPAGAKLATVGTRDMPPPPPAPKLPTTRSVPTASASSLGRVSASSSDEPASITQKRRRDASDEARDGPTAHPSKQPRLVQPVHQKATPRGLPTGLSGFQAYSSIRLDQSSSSESTSNSATSPNRPMRTASRQLTPPKTTVTESTSMLARPSNGTAVGGKARRLVLLGSQAENEDQASGKAATARATAAQTQSNDNKAAFTPAHDATAHAPPKDETESPAMPARRSGASPSRPARGNDSKLPSPPPTPEQIKLGAYRALDLRPSMKTTALARAARDVESDGMASSTPASSVGQSRVDSPASQSRNPHSDAHATKLAVQVHSKRSAASSEEASRRQPKHKTSVSSDSDSDDEQPRMGLLQPSTRADVKPQRKSKLKKKASRKYTYEDSDYEISDYEIDKDSDREADNDSDREADKDSDREADKDSDHDADKDDEQSNEVDSDCDICKLIVPDSDLLMCDTCTSSFHLPCLNYSEVPAGTWLCPDCDARGKLFGPEFFDMRVSVDVGLAQYWEARERCILAFERRLKERETLKESLLAKTNKLESEKLAYEKAQEHHERKRDEIREQLQAMSSSIAALSAWFGKNSHSGPAQSKADLFWLPAEKLQTTSHTTHQHQPSADRTHVAQQRAHPAASTTPSVAPVSNCGDDEYSRGGCHSHDAVK
ncbi:hypothetical protein CAOG_008018 [Capsaspora owczarzaki ATCC 30864]|uniref:PHD-type domain-containing protein n=1 Tax=Capsaspora owczarzaki (strain ATCC 30864) TaxID=595528 RepID=A0A0D2WYF4_CAPO3|nr:hypothetical protein CAOG_008018 [Capsaspora owczarzaki ATCC 30864]